MTKTAARTLLRSPGFTLIAVATLALGMGGATAIFSVADAVILRPLPYRDPNRLVFISLSDRERNQPFVEFSYPAYREWRARTRLFQSVAAMSSVNDEVILTGRGEPMAVEGRWVTGEFFPVLDVAPARGRTLRPEDDKPGAPNVIVLSHQFWRDRLSASPDVVGTSLTLDGRPWTVVGVMPPEFAYPRGAAYWIPVATAGGGTLVENRGIFWMVGVGRLQDGTSFEAARTELTAIWQQFHRSDFKPEGYSSVLTPFSDTVFGPTRAALIGLLGAVALILAMACANVAGLLLVRAARRHSDVSIRQALGASRARLALDALAEASILAILGGIGGLIVAAAATPLLVAFAPADVPRLQDVALNTRAFGVAAGMSMLVALASALAPISLIGRGSWASLARASARRVIFGRSPAGAALVVAEIAIAVVVLVAAGLVGRSFAKLRDVPLGFQPDRVLSVRITPKGEAYPDNARIGAFYRQLLERVRGEPGVVSAAAVSIRPLWSTVGYDWTFTIEGQADGDARRNPHLNLMAVSPDYFSAMGIPLRRGRAFIDRDANGQPGVAIVGESMAARVWPGQDPVGKRIKMPMGDDWPYHNTWLTVVGVAGDARYRELQAVRLDFYLPYLQANIPVNYLVVRSSGKPTALMPSVRAVVRTLDPNVAVTESVAMDEVVSQALGNPRFAATLLAVFGSMALGLAALGVYGLLAYSVTCRTQEIGVRVALGANAPNVLRTVLAHTVRLTIAGVAIGLASAALLVRLVEGLLFGVEPVDPVTFGAVALALAVTALLASLAPALRAIRVDPLVALRCE
jgi:putative ABC transport system permease protein